MRRFVPALLLAFWLCAGCTRPSHTLGRAALLADKGRFSEAQAELEAHLRDEPDDIAARRLLVRVHGFTGDLGRARAEAERLSAVVGPQSPLPWLELGHALELAHRYDEALALYDRAAEVAPRDPAGPRTGGLRAARWGEHELARPRLEEALRRAPRDAKTWHALGVVCLGLGDLDSAEHAYRSGLMAEPRALENRLGLATVAVARNDAGAALREYDAILAERPRFTDAALGRSWALLTLGRLDEAERALADAEQSGANARVVARQRTALRALRSSRPERDVPAQKP